MFRLDYALGNGFVLFVNTSYNQGAVRNVHVQERSLIFRARCTREKELNFL